MSGVKLPSFPPSLQQGRWVTDAERDSALARLQEFNAQLEAEKQMRRHAAMWERLAATHIDTLYNLADAAPTTESFLAHFEQ